MVAENGEEGGKNRRYGRDGKDTEIGMPVGTLLIDKDSGEEFELNNVGEKILLCKGGLGGRGNAELANSRNTTPKYAQRGLPGKERSLQVILKLIADFGLIGLPNAGKSSLLNELTAAKVKVADYPFTTLEPNLGVFQGKIVADIPGLIEGAAEGRGLGIKFLKHIEKVGLLLHTVSSESEDMVGSYSTVRKEMGEFNPGLLQKKEIILITKSDLVSKEELEKRVKLMKRLKKPILPVSIYDWESLEKLKDILLSQTTP